MADIVRRDPFRNLFAWPHWLDDFDAAFPTFTSQRGLRVHEDNKNIYLEAVVAGVPEDDVEVNIEDGVVTVKAEKKVEEKKKGEYKTSEYNYYYTCALSGGQWNKAKAEVDHGVLELTIPKAEEVRPQKVAVKAKAKKK
jgi:HSP20 family protein